jgi:hypothetical protein
MLLLAERISRNTGDIFEIHLDFRQRLGALNGFALASALVSDAV